MWHSGLGGVSEAPRQISIPNRTQWVKDPALPQLWYRLQMWLGSDPWPRNSICRRVAKKKKKKKKDRMKQLTTACLIKAGREGFGPSKMQLCPGKHD